MDAECPSCTGRSWIDLMTWYSCRNCRRIYINPKHLIEKEVLRQYKVFLRNYPAHIERSEKHVLLWWIENITQKKTWLLRYKVQKVRQKVKFHKSISDYYGQMNFWDKLYFSIWRSSIRYQFSTYSFFVARSFINIEIFTKKATG